MKGKTLLSLAIVATMLLAIVPFATVKAANPLKISVIFDETGTSTLTKAAHSDFTVSVLIADVPSPGIDFFSIKMTDFLIAYSQVYPNNVHEVPHNE